ncbi:MAG TPA: murein endopeptidase, partial [Minicystis sp.]|nr:murein endopeptidase [Minicystis sp.]
LVRALVEGDNVASIFMDRAVQALLREHALAIGEDEAFVARLFGTEGDARDNDARLVHHASGHATHFHVRFRDPVSVALGMRLRALMTPRPKKPLSKRP